MDENKLETAINNLKENLVKFDDKSFNVYFFVFDSKGRASGELEYIYRSALSLKELGYKVSMLYQLTKEEKDNGEEFVGVAGWLGDEYADIPHYNIETDEVTVSPADFMIIPEVFSDIMISTSKVPCKRIALLYNFGLIQTFMPKSRTWPGLGIRDAITTTETQAKLLDEIFPEMNIKNVRPCVLPVFQKSSEPKEISVNIIARDPSDFKRVSALFYWKYPYFKWVRFNELTEISQEVFAENLQKSPITVWLDNPTYFGISALEAMKCGSLVIAKVPETEPEWAMENGEIRNNAVWFYNINDVHNIIAGAVNGFINDNLPTTYQEEADKTVQNYTVDIHKTDIEKVYVEHFFEGRKKELEVALSVINKEKEEKTTENE